MAPNAVNSFIFISIFCLNDLFWNLCFNVSFCFCPLLLFTSLSRSFLYYWNAKTNSFKTRWYHFDCDHCEHKEEAEKKHNSIYFKRKTKINFSPTWIDLNQHSRVSEANSKLESNGEKLSRSTGLFQFMQNFFAETKRLEFN